MQKQAHSIKLLQVLLQIARRKVFTLTHLPSIAYRPNYPRWRTSNASLQTFAEKIDSCNAAGQKTT